MRRVAGRRAGPQGDRVRSQRLPGHEPHLHPGAGDHAPRSTRRPARRADHSHSDRAADGRAKGGRRLVVHQRRRFTAGSRETPDAHREAGGIEDTSERSRFTFTPAGRQRNHRPVKAIGAAAVSGRCRYHVRQLQHAIRRPRSLGRPPPRHPHRRGTQASRGLLPRHAGRRPLAHVPKTQVDERPANTCSGLLGLAIGAGIVREKRAANASRRHKWQSAGGSATRSRTRWCKSP